MSEPHFHALCLSGGGVTGFVHLGVLKYLEEHNLVSTIHTIATTSVGAIIGTLFAIGMTSTEIFDSLLPLSDDLLQYDKIDKFFTTFGMESGEYFLAVMMDIFLQKNVSPTITFYQLFQSRKVNLIITGTNVSKHQTTYFSRDTYPDMRVLDAVRISISIPILFTTPMFEGDLYVDGGIRDNYPLDYVFDRMVIENGGTVKDAKKSVIGSCIDSLVPRKIVDMESFIEGLFASCLKRSPADPLCTVYTQITDVSVIDFSPDPIKRSHMVQMGYDNAQQYMETRRKLFDNEKSNRDKSSADEAETKSTTGSETDSRGSFESK